jgi:hypothetical protein
MHKYLYNQNENKIYHKVESGWLSAPINDERMMMDFFTPCNTPVITGTIPVELIKVDESMYIM